MTVTVHMVDVFGTGPFSGNPLAVVMGADDLDTDGMLAITRWFNLSETTFLLPPTHADADYKVRIFYPGGELPFAGHPTLGSCHAWLEAGGTPKSDGVVVQECGVGLVSIRRDQGPLAFAAPPLIRSGPPSAEALAEALAFLKVSPDAVVDAAWVDNGPGWLGIKFGSAADVLALEPARSWTRPIKIGVLGPHAPGADAAFEVRAFVGDHLGGIVEDPVTGSLNASLACWLFQSGAVDGGYIAAQGTRLGRRGRVTVSRDGDGTIWIGGETRTQVAGALTR